MEDKIQLVADILSESKYTVVFTGAGISVESGIPPFRGTDGLWSRYDPTCLELGYFHRNPKESWAVLKEIFYDFMAHARPNPAHFAIADLEKHGIVREVITQNIDNLHQEAGSRIVHEFHGSTRYLVCLECGKRVHSTGVNLDLLPPQCESCQGVLKPDFVFFSEMIPEKVSRLSFAAAEKSDVMILVGTTGEVMPAAYIPYTAKEKNRALIVEVNPEPSLYTAKLTDIFLQGKAGNILPLLASAVLKGKKMDDPVI